MSEPLAPAREALFTRPFLLLSLAHFLNALGWSTSLLFPLYVDSLAADRADIGLVMASAGLGGLAVRPVVGWALDVIGRRPIILVGTVLVVLSLALVWFVRDVGPLMVVHRVIFGVGLGILFTAYFTFAADVVPASRRTEGIALFGVSGLLPLALNAFVEDVGFGAGELRAFYPIAAGIVALSAIPVLFVPEPAKPAQAARFRWGAMLRAVAERRLWPVWVATTTFAMLASVFMSFSTVAAQAAGAARPADLWLTYALGAVSVRLFGARLPDRVGPERLVAPALGVYVAGMVICAAATSGGAFLVAGAVAGVGHGYCFPVLMSQVVSRSPEALRGSAVAMYTALWVVAELALTPVFGAVADAAGDATMFVAAAGTAVLGLIIWRVLEGVHGRP